MTNKNSADLFAYQAPPDYLAERVILITGASRGIGKALALACAHLGARVIMLAKDLKRLEQAYDEIVALNKATPAILNIDLEMAGADDYHTVANAVAEQYGHLDGLVLNAGRVNGLTPLPNIELSAWTKLINLHVHSPYLLTRSCLPLLKKSPDASIVFSVDDAQRAYWGAYGVGKQAQLGLLHILADELDGDRLIRVNGVHPGAVRTDLRTHNYPGVNPHQFPPPDTVVAPYIYLLGSAADRLTNQVIQRDAD
ncbi:MAG: hypothetical protein CBC79_05245 [Gammaproteobacteria bacterium TMED119]|nr:MAG: hypothetical protein CBC79_05245 [Gammaproteobacteria bacterium TMED119]|tara:strand:- start:1553 stop:2314 length:762 start_codon:yes stop_codon:yes gene_type:complete